MEKGRLEGGEREARRWRRGGWKGECVEKGKGWRREKGRLEGGETMHQIRRPETFSVFAGGGINRPDHGVSAVPVGGRAHSHATGKNPQT